MDKFVFLTILFFILILSAHIFLKFVYNNKKITPFNTPNFLFGFSSNKEFYCFKDLKGFYTASKLNDLMNLYDLKEVNEIGAGLGYVAYYFSQMNNNNFPGLRLSMSNLPH